MVLTRRAGRVDSTDISTPTKTPRVQVTFSTDRITTEAPKPADDSTHHARVETSDNSDEGASSSSVVSSRRICSTPSCPIVQSEVDSCASSVSCRSSRRTTRSRQYCDTPVPSISHRVTRSQQKMSLALSRAKAHIEQSVSSSENSNVSDTDCSSRRSTRSRKKLELTDVHSPIGSLCSAQGEGTPCSSRTGSGYSSCGAPSISNSVRSVTVVDDAVEGVKEDEASNCSSSDCTLIPMSEGEVVELTPADADSKKVEVVLSEDVPACNKEAVPELVMIKEDQQVEPPADYQAEDTSEIEMKKLVLSGEPSEPAQSVRVTICESASEIPVDAEEKQQDEDGADEEAHSAQSVGPLPEAEVVEIQPSVEISPSTGDSQKVVQLQGDSVHVTPDQQHGAVAESAPKKTKIISLLDCSDEDEESDEEEAKMEVSEEKERGGSISVSAASVDGLFMIDTRPGSDVGVQYYQEGREGGEARSSKGVEEEDKFVDEEGEDDDDDNAFVLFPRRRSHLTDLSSRIDPGIKVKDVGRLYISFDGSSSKPGGSSSQQQKEKKIQDDVMKKSVIGPDYEKKDAVPPYSESKQALKSKRKAERAKSTGEAWFNMKAPELTPELKKDLQVLKMRGALDSKRFYKKNDRDGFPKYFQVGTVVDSAVDYHSRIPRKERKRTMVEELLADAEFRQNNKKKYQHIVSERAASSKRSKKMNR